MMDFSAAKLSEKAQYNLLIGAILPRPVVLVATQSTTQVLNLAPFSFVNIVSYQPAILSLSVQRKNGEMKDTARNLLAQKEAVVHVVSETILADANQTAAPLLPNESELARTQFTLATSKCVNVPAIREADVRYEVRLYQHVPIQQANQEVTADLFLLEVVHYHIAETIYANGHIDVRALNPMSRLAGSHYAKIGDLITLERPQ
ncbi:MAG: flavin reductase family protein [Aerococcaceae bacterium]|nr:flavin reductase family protein [Aerococcaceae bacterium]